MNRLDNIHDHLNPSILTSTSHDRVLITLNRPTALNAINLALINGLRSAFDISKERKLKIILKGNSNKAFCAGGDVVSMMQEPFIVPELFRRLNDTIYSISCYCQETAVWWRGIVMGGGVGVSMCCDYRIATPTTVWSMPETLIGVIPDVGASYFFSHMKIPSLGLYLSLTGARLTGEDCYYAGLATHYIPSDIDIPSILMQHPGRPLNEILDFYHITPPLEKATTLSHLPEIESCFGRYTDIACIYSNLKNLNTDWAVSVLETLSERCPLSLKVAIEMFNRGFRLTYGECLMMEYDAMMQLVIHKNDNFKLAVDKRLLKKQRDRPDWVPGDIHLIPDDIAHPILLNKEGPHLYLYQNAKIT